MFLIRADGNAKIGAGHLMRCLTIADELRKLVDIHKILFVCADLQSAELALKRGYEAFLLWSDPCDMEAEIPAWSRIPVENKKTNVIVVDSYFATKNYLQKIGEYGSITLMDDMGEKCFPVDRVINYNAFADTKHYEDLYKDSDTELILGSVYVPVRPQFRRGLYQIRKKAENVLITTGGGDIDNIAGQILRHIQEKETGEMLNYHLTIGKFNPHFEHLKALEKQSVNVHIYHDVQDMAGLMRRCDLAVTAGGSTVYELAAVGVPFICFSYAENQEKITEYISREEIAFSAGAYHRNREAVLEKIAEYTIELAKDYSRRNTCYSKERKLIDGLGAERLAKLIVESTEGIAEKHDNRDAGKRG